MKFLIDECLSPKLATISLARSWRLRSRPIGRFEWTGIRPSLPSPFAVQAYSWPSRRAFSLNPSSSSSGVPVTQPHSSTERSADFSRVRMASVARAFLRQSKPNRRIEKILEGINRFRDRLGENLAHRPR